MEIWKRVTELEGELIDLYHRFHRHPETAWQEHESTAFISHYLENLGLEVFHYPSHTGCWTEIHGKKDVGKTILLRADYDALPIQEETGLPYASENPGVFHGCGHDSHAAMLLIACKILTELREEFSGTVRVLFQAAEETANGAEYFVQQGILDHVDAVYGCHTVTWLDAPYVSVNGGPRMASTDEFRIDIQGHGCHGGMPHLGNDAVIAACAVVINLQTIVSRNTDPLDALVVTVGCVEGGSAYNVVADSAQIRGTVRAYSPAVRDSVPEKMRLIAEHTAAALGCTAELTYVKKTGAVIHSDLHMVQLAEKAAVKLFGENGKKDIPPVGASDDFAYFSEKVPGLYAFIGGANAALGCTYPHHHPKFQIDESVLVRGAAMHVQMAIDFLSETVE